MKKLTGNMITSILSKIILILTSLIVQRKILITFGSDINGLSSSISQILAYLTLLEAGIGSASIQALYRPLAENDWDDANGILSATKKQYQKTGIIFFLLLSAIAFLMPVVIGNQMDTVLVILFTFIAGMSSVISYMMTGKYVVLFTADKSISIIYIIDSTICIITCLLRIVAVKLNYSILIVQSVLVAGALLKAIILSIIFKKKYRNISFEKKPDLQSIGKRWSVLIHQISSLVVNHTDVTLLTVASTLKNVSVYSVYNYIYANIAGLFNQTFVSAALASFGHLAAKDSKEYKKAYVLYETIYTTVLFITMVSAFVLTKPFVALYTKGVSDIEYWSLSVAILFCINQFMNLIRIPALVTINAYGWFKETQKGAVVEAVLNLSVSLALLPIWGMKGLLIGTLVSFLFRTQDVIRYVYKRCSFGYASFLKLIISNVGLSCIIIWLFRKVQILEIVNWLGWLVYALIVVIITTLLFAVMNYILNKRILSEVKSILKRVGG